MPYKINNRIQFLYETGKILSSSLDYNVTLVIVSKLIVESIADFCIIDILENDVMKRVAVRAYRKSDQELASRMYEFPPDPHNKGAIYDSVENDLPIVIKKNTKKWLSTVSRIKEERELINQMRLNSHMFAPLRSRGRVIGVLTIASTDKDFEYSQEDALLINSFAARAAMAVDNSKLFSEAQAAIQTRDEFLSIASHELKTPLAGILLALQFAIRHLKKDENFTDESVFNALNTGVVQTRRLSGLINDLLNVSTMSSGELSIEREECDLVGMISDTLKGFEFQLQKEKIDINFTSEYKTLWGNWDRSRIEEVITNLISNAIKYGNRKPIKVELEKKNEKAIIRVIDKGMGIRREEQKAIFELFRRTVAAQDLKGMGIGLYISNQIVKAHNGKIYVKSIEGKGSTFMVELPIQ